MTSISTFWFRKAKSQVFVKKDKENSGAPFGGVLEVKKANPKSNANKLVLSSLPGVDFKELIILPPGLCYNEWLAWHCYTIFENTSIIYDSISESCTSTACPAMTGPTNTLYYWFDDKGKKSKMSSPQYIENAMSLIHKTILNDMVFPTKHGVLFPSTFESLVKKISKLLFHTMAHVYHSHFSNLLSLGLDCHANTVFTHLIFFVKHFNLLEPASELNVLADFCEALDIGSIDLHDEGSSPLTATTLEQNLSHCSFTTSASSSNSSSSSYSSFSAPPRLTNGNCSGHGEDCCPCLANGVGVNANDAEVGETLTLMSSTTSSSLHPTGTNAVAISPLPYTTCIDSANNSINEVFDSLEENLSLINLNSSPSTYVPSTTECVDNNANYFPIDSHLNYYSNMLK